MFWIRWGSVAMFTAVALGAFAAHALKARLTPEMQVIYEVGIRYHIVHALALFVVAWLSRDRPDAYVTAAGWLFVVGIALFSGSLYALSLSGARTWGMVTPVGGLCFLAGWTLIGLATIRSR